MGIACSAETQQEKFQRYIEMSKLEKLRKLDYTKIDIHDSDEKAFITACEGRLDIVQFLIKLGEESKKPINIHAQKGDAFFKACACYNFDVVKYLIQLGEKGYGKVNIHANQEYAFRSACERQNLAFMKYLINLGENGYGRINIHACHEDAFISLCENLWDTRALVYLLDLRIKGYGWVNMDKCSVVFKNVIYKGSKYDLVYLISLYEEYNNKKRFNIHMENDALIWYAFDWRKFEIFDYFIELANDCGYGYILSDGTDRHYYATGEYYRWKPVNGSRKLFRLTIASHR